MRSFRTFFFGVLICITFWPAFSVAQTGDAVQAEAAPARASYSQAELDQLLAPMALYPDALLSQVLMASTYPLEVVKAQRWLQQHPGLSGSALDSALANEPWDDSVKALAAFPSVVAMMNDNLDWTQKLGDAFLTQQADVMDTVQALRQKAQSAGTLYSNAQQQITAQDGEIGIAPTNPDMFYVPAYDPGIVYGPWWWPGYPPFVWWPPSIYGPFAYIATGFAFGLGVAIGHDHFHDAHPDWHHHQINVRPGHHHGSVSPGGPTPWHHDPAHRIGVPYPTPGVRGRYVPVNPGAITQRQDYRGYQGSPRPQPAVRPAPPIGIPQAPRAASPFSPESRRSVQGYSQRGHASLSAPRPIVQPSALASRPIVQPSAPASRQIVQPSAPAPRQIVQPSAPSGRGGQAPAPGQHHR